jgi:hypothetical protein
MMFTTQPVYRILRVIQGRIEFGNEIYIVFLGLTITQRLQKVRTIKSISN